MNVLSLFDGMSCGRIALERAGIKPDNYFASEVDKYAISVAKHNYPDIKHIGDVTQVKASDLPSIDLLIGGSPCQGFSFAGKQLNFEDPRSKLFFEYVRLLKEIQSYNPHVLFLLENVKMKKEYQDVISEYMGVQPIKINSALVSAQNRERLYWTNIPVNSLPGDRGLVLNDIIEDGFVDRDKSYALDASFAKKTISDYQNRGRGQIVFLGNVNPSGKGMNGNVYSTEGKCPTLTTNKGEGIKVATCLQVGILGSKYEQGNRIYSVEGKCPTLMHGSPIGGAVPPKIAVDEKYWRKLTPLECERLQTMPDNYTATVSNSQRYKMLGNGWTVDVIAHIFKNLDLLC